MNLHMRHLLLGVFSWEALETSKLYRQSRERSPIRLTRQITYLVPAGHDGCRWSTNMEVASSCNCKRGLPSFPEHLPSLLLSGTMPQCLLTRAWVPMIMVPTRQKRKSSTDCSMPLDINAHPRCECASSAPHVRSITRKSRCFHHAPPYGTLLG